MKIIIDRRRDGFTVKIDRPPMKENRFRALCALAAAGIYAGMVWAVIALCGLLGLIAVGGVTVLIALLSAV